jgi:purine-binding chemotaxis protein CheW
MAANRKADAQAVLEARALELARLEEAPTAGAASDMLVFQVAWENYALDMSAVREVYPLRDLTAIPCTPAFILGVVNVRGELCPVIDLKRLLGLPARGLSNATAVVILENRELEIGVVADVVVGVQAIEAASIAAAPGLLAGIHAAFLRGVAPGPIAVLDADRLLGHPDLVVDQQVGA